MTFGGNSKARKVLTLVQMDGRWILQITTTTTMPTGSYQLSVYGYAYSILENNMGDLRTYNSA
jgi:hypothetical protein